MPSAAALTPDEIKELKAWHKYKECFDIALRIHQKEHDSQALHFRNCLECKSGFAILFIDCLEKEKNALSSKSNP